MAKDERKAVLLMSFGGPEALDEVPAFVRSVLGRTPPAGLVTEITERYRSLGGGSPLPEVTRRQAEALATELRRRGYGWAVAVGMQHARPTLDEAIARLAEAGVERAVALSLAPYRSQASTAAYEATVSEVAARRAPAIDFAFPPDWYAHPTYVQALADRLERTLEGVPDQDRVGVPVIFSAHSIPTRFVEAGDPYVQQLESTIQGVLGRLHGIVGHLAFQSRSGAAREPWVGPDVEEVMDRLKGEGASTVVVDPIGFVTDHMETLYDNDVVHRAHAEEIGLRFHRCRCLNTDPRFVAALAEIAVEAMAS